MAEEITMYKCPKCKELFTREESAEMCCKCPSKLKKPRYADLRAFAQDYVECARKGGEVVDNDGEEAHAALDVIIRSFYKEGIWKWIHSRDSSWKNVRYKKQRHISMYGRKK